MKVRNPEGAFVYFPEKWDDGSSKSYYLEDIYNENGHGEMQCDCGGSSFSVHFVPLEWDNHIYIVCQHCMDMSILNTDQKGNIT